MAKVGLLVTLPAIGPSDVVTIGTYLVVLFLPGGLLAALCGLRGLTLAAAAPLFTYAVAGLAGPFYSELGWAWNPWTALAAFAVPMLVAAAVRLIAVRLAARRRARPEPPGEQLPEAAPTPATSWSWQAWLGVGGCIGLAAAVGATAILSGIHVLDAIPQDWDAVFHAGGIRLISTTGDGGLYAMATTNWFENGVTVFYPNAYHLVAAVVYTITGAPIPAVLNAHTVLIPGMLALSMTALVRRYSGRALLTALTALASVSVTSFYDLLWRGPLLPFATGVALTPMLVVLCVDLLDATGRRERWWAAVCFVTAMVGLLCLHPAILIGGILFTIPALVQRWIATPRALPRDLVLLVTTGIVAAALCVLQLGGMLSSAGNLEAIVWPADLTVPDALRALLLYGHEIDTDQIRLTILLALGILCWPTLGTLRWVVATSVIFATLFVIAAASEAPWAKQITSLWWNDRWRLIALAAVPLCVVIAHGVAQTQRWLVGLVERLAAARGRHVSGQVVALGSALAAIVVFLVVTRGLYLDRDAERMTENSGDGPSVSHLEAEGMAAVGPLVPPGERVLNDRGDGSVWLYALTGADSVATHFDAHRTGPDAKLLAERFNQYATDPAVRAAVERLNVHFVQVDTGFLRDDAHREPGLTNLDGQPWLQLVYANPDLRFYRIVDPALATPDTGSNAANPNAGAAGEPAGQGR